MKIPALAIVCVVGMLPAHGQSITEDERNLVIDMLKENSKRFLADIEHVHESQWRFKPSKDTWSVAELAEHIILAEGLLLSIAQKSLNLPEEKGKASALQGKENAVIERLKDRTQKAMAPDVLRPANTFTTKKELVEAFKIAREKTLNYVRSTKDPLKNHIVAHPSFGDLTAYQWLVMIPAHANRHVAQLEEVKASKEFPLE